MLEQLSHENSQVILTTHSPYFVSARGFESVRLFRRRRTPSETCVAQATFADLTSKLQEALGQSPGPPTSVIAAVAQIMQPSQNEMYFCACPILVEGIEDVAFVATYLQVSGRWDVFRRLGCHFVVAGGKTNMSRPMLMAQLLGLEPFVIFDGDADKVSDETRSEIRRDNGCLLSLADVAADPLATATVCAGSLTMWHTSLTDTVRKDVGGDRWIEIQERVRVQHGYSNVSGKNGLLIAAIVETAYSEGVRIASLDRLCEALLLHATQQAS